MTTKPPAGMKPAPEMSLEKIAYTSVSGIPTADPHDQDRLGFNVYQLLQQRRGTLEEAVHTAKARIQVSETEAVRQIRESLKQQGVEV